MSRLVILLLCCLPLGLAAQYVPTNETGPRYIQVTGSAEMTVPADEIELAIQIRGKDRRDMAQQERAFYATLDKYRAAVVDLGLTDNNYGWYYWWSARQQREASQKTYQVRLNERTDMLGLVQELDKMNIYSLRISEKSHSRIREYRRTVKIDAMKAAKEKAAYLLESVDEELGGVLSIVEIPNNTDSNRWYRENVISNVVSATPGSAGKGIDNVPAITLRYEVRVKFAIEE